MQDSKLNLSSINIYLINIIFQDKCKIIKYNVCYYLTNETSLNIFINESNNKYESLLII